VSWSKQRIKLKTPEQIEKMAASAETLVAVFRAVGDLVAAGKTTEELAAAVEAMIRDAGCIPSFKGYNGFPAAACISVNEEVVHGIPSARKLQEGDIVGIDIGLIKDGWHADSAETFAVGEISPEAKQLLRVTRECLELAIAAVQAGRRLSVIGTAVEEHAMGHGFSVVESLVGHGIGRDLHEDPQVPRSVDRGHGGQESVGPFRAHGSGHCGLGTGPDTTLSAIARKEQSNGEGRGNQCGGDRYRGPAQRHVPGGAR